jgi:hypothetical protein
LSTPKRYMRTTFPDTWAPKRISSVHFRFCDDLAVIQVAIEVGALCLLPVAYYNVGSGCELQSILSENHPWARLPETLTTTLVVGYYDQLQFISHIFGCPNGALRDESDCDNLESCDAICLKFLRAYPTTCEARALILL